MIDPKSLVGQQIKQYRLTRHIARGGMADVYLAHDSTLNRSVALKIMLPVLAADDQFVSRFQREAQTVASLDHPHIVHIYDFGRMNNGRPYLAMQFVEGGSLQDTLDRVAQSDSRIDTRQALGIIGKMTDALQVAHAAGVVHRDIKPSNILIRPDGRPVLVDLGIAAVQGGPKLTQTGTLVGTPHYMSPEQAGGKEVDGRSDLYSLGVILYEMLAGQRPFTVEEPMAILHHHVYETPPPLSAHRPDLSADTNHVVTTCLAKNPDLRFQTAADLRQAINQALQAEGGPGVISDAGVWQPHPSGEYRLSPSKIVPPDGDRPTSPLRWLWLAVPILLIGLVFLLFQLNPGLFTFSSNGQPPAAAVSSTPPRATTTPDQITAVAQIPLPTQTETSVQPTATFAALPTFTPAPSPTASPTPTPTATVDPRPTTTEIGQSVNGQPIQAVQFGSGPQRLLFIGGLHAGFAPATVDVANQLIDYLTNNPQTIPANATIIVIPNANPDSPSAPGQLNGRLNANDVDLNRNWDCRWTTDARWRGNVIPDSGGPTPLSEPESRALHDFIMSQSPAAVVFWEARASNGLSAPGVCGANSRVSGPLAQSYGFAAGYPVADFENLTNQELNGDATNWLDDQNIPALAILLPDYDDTDWVSNLAGIRAVIRDFGQ